VLDFRGASCGLSAECAHDRFGGDHRQYFYWCYVFSADKRIEDVDLYRAGIDLCASGPFMDQPI